MEGLEHRRFCYELYQIQIDGGRYFDHETPDDTWTMLTDFTQDVIDQPEVHKVRGDMCMCGMVSQDHEGEAPAKKPT
eukprot:16191365-Heterocapsa_arctica.AAC.1